MKKILFLGLTTFIMFAIGCGNSISDDCIDESKIRQSNCPDNIEPVCGCNGVTYDNGCRANAAGVTSFTKGACK